MFHHATEVHDLGPSSGTVFSPSRVCKGQPTVRGCPACKTRRSACAVSAMINDFASWAGGKLGGKDAARPPATAAGPEETAFAAAQLQSDAEAGKKAEASLRRSLTPAGPH